MVSAMNVITLIKAFGIPWIYDLDFFDKLMSILFMTESVKDLYKVQRR